MADPVVPEYPGSVSREARIGGADDGGIATGVGAYLVDGVGSFFVLYFPKGGRLP